MSKTILLLRHAEEPKDPASLDLSQSGRNRAEKLASFIPAQFGVPDFVFAASPTGTSVRAYLTMRPLADALKARIDGSYKARDFGPLASKLLNDPVFVSKLIVVCWTHSELPALANSLHVRPGDFPKRWDEKVFNLIFRLAYKQRVTPKVKKFPQPF